MAPLGTSADVHPLDRHEDQSPESSTVGSDEVHLQPVRAFTTDPWY